MSNPTKWGRIRLIFTSSLLFNCQSLLIRTLSLILLLSNHDWKKLKYNGLSCACSQIDLCATEEVRAWKQGTFEFLRKTENVFEHFSAFSVGVVCNFFCFSFFLRFFSSFFVISSFIFVIVLLNQINCLPTQKKTSCRRSSVFLHSFFFGSLKLINHLN